MRGGGPASNVHLITWLLNTQQSFDDDEWKTMADCLTFEFLSNSWPFFLIFFFSRVRQDGELVNPELIGQWREYARFVSGDADDAISSRASLNCVTNASGHWRRFAAVNKPKAP